MSVESQHKFVTPAESIIVMAICFRRDAFLPTTCHTEKLPGRVSIPTALGGLRGYFCLGAAEGETDKE